MEDQSSLSNEQVIETIQNHLSSTFRASSGIEQKHAEEELQKFLERDPQFIKYLLIIISQSSTLDQIKESACLYVNTCLRKLLNSNDCSMESRIEWSDLLMDAFKEPSIPFKNKMKLSYSLNLIISSTKQNDVRITVFTKILEWLNVRERQFSTACLIALQVIFSSVSETKYLYKIFDSIELGYCQIASFFSSTLSTLLKSKVGDSHPPLLSNQAKQAVSECLHILNLWANTFKRIVKQFQKQQNQQHQMLVLKILQSEQISKITFELLELNPYAGCKIESNEFLSQCYISMSGCKEIDEGLNQLKGTIFQIYGSLLDFTFLNRPNISVDGNQFYTMLSVLLPQILKSLHYFCNQQKFRSDMNLHSTIENSEFIDRLLTQKLNLLKIIGSQIDFYKIISENLVTILADILFPLAASSKRELLMMVENPEDFLSLQDDCCDKQVNSINQIFKGVVLNGVRQDSKSKVFSAIEMMVDHIDGAMLAVTTYAINIAQYALNSETINEIDKKYPSIACFKNGVLLNTLPSEIQLETALMMLTCICYNIEEREGLLEQLQTLIRDNLFTLKNPNLPNIVKCRFANLISKYYDKIFWNVEDIPVFEQCVMQVFNYLECTSESSRAVQLTAIESLDSMYFDEDYSQRLIQTIQPAIDILVKHLPSIDCPIYLDLIYSITQKFSSVLKENQHALSKIINSLVAKMIDENQKIQTTSTQTSIVLNKGMSILKGICENGNYVPRYIFMIESKLQELMQNIKNSVEGSFDDEMLSVLVSLIKHSNKLTDLVKTILPNFPPYFQKKQEVLSNLFELLNYAFIHGTEYFKQNPLVLANLIEICLRSTYTKTSKEVYITESGRAQGPILLQIIIQSLGSEFSADLWSTIVQSTVQRIEMPDEKLKFFRNRLLGVLLISLASSFGQVQPLLQSKLDLILEQVTRNAGKVGTPYDRKIYILSISQILTNDINTFTPELKKYIPALLETVVLLLAKQKSEEEKILAKLQAKRNKQQSQNSSSKKQHLLSGQQNQNNYDSDSDSSFDDSDDEFDQEQAVSHLNGDDDENHSDEEALHIPSAQEEAFEDQLTLKKLANPFINTDEFAYFKQRILSVQQKDPAFFQQLIQASKQSVVESMQGLLQIERIKTTVASDQGTTVTQLVPRKIIKAKRKLNSTAGGQMSEAKIDCEK